MSAFNGMLGYYTVRSHGGMGFANRQAWRRGYPSNYPSGGGFGFNYSFEGPVPPFNGSENQTEWSRPDWKLYDETSIPPEPFP